MALMVCCNDVGSVDLPCEMVRVFLSERAIHISNATDIVTVLVYLCLDEGAHKPAFPVARNIHPGTRGRHTHKNEHYCYGHRMFDHLSSFPPRLGRSISSPSRKLLTDLRQAQENLRLQINKFPEP